MSRAPVAGDVRCVWLSFTDKNSGISCGSPLHFASYSNQINKPILVTLKAGIVQKFMAEYDVLANAVATCLHKEIVTAVRSRALLIAFDADYYQNNHVARSLARLLNSIFEDTVLKKVQSRIKILTWNTKIKGFDEALLQNISINSITPLEWFNSLTVICKQEVCNYYKSIKSIV